MFCPLPDQYRPGRRDFEVQVVTPGKPGEARGSTDRRKRIRSRDVWTIVEVAEYLRVHRGTVYRLVREGKLPAFKVGGEWRFFSDVVDEWLMSDASRRMRQRDD